MTLPELTVLFRIKIDTIVSVYAASKNLYLDKRQVASAKAYVKYHNRLRTEQYINLKALGSTEKYYHLVVTWIEVKKLAVGKNYILPKPSIYQNKKRLYGRGLTF